MPKKKKKIIIGLIAVLAIGGIGYNVLSTALDSANVSSTALAYSAIKAGQNNLSKTISAKGSVIGNGTVDVTSKLTTEISEVNVSLGDHVKKGDQLCVFDSTELQEKYDELEAKLEKADKKTENSHEKNVRDLEDAKTAKTTAVNRALRNLNKAISERDNAYNTYNALVNEYNSHLNDPPEGEYDFDTVYKMIENLYSGLSAYDEEVTMAQDLYDDTVKKCDYDIQAAQEAIDDEEFDDSNDAQKQLDELAEELAQCVVTAPQDGVVTAVNVNEGTIPTATSLMTIVNTDQTVIELTLKETDIVRISEGMSAVVTSNVLPDEEFPAKLTRIVNVLSADEGYKVEVTLDTPNEQLLIGMSASVEITTEDIGEKLSLPYSGIVEEDGATVVYVAIPDDETPGSYIAKKVEITTGYESDFYTEISGGDIKEGDLIIDNPSGDNLLSPVTDGERISLND